jgi:hypothetical protein
MPKYEITVTFFVEAEDEDVAYSRLDATLSAHLESGPEFDIDGWDILDDIVEAEPF